MLPRLSTKKLRVFPFCVIDPSYAKLVELSQNICRGAHKSIYCANDLAHQVRHIADQADEERIQVQRIEDTSNNFHEVAESDNELQIDVDVSNCDVDFLDSDLDTGVDLHKACNLCIEVKISLKLFYDQFNSSNVEFGNLEENIWNRGGSNG
jgi:hypothetical protein